METSKIGWTDFSGGIWNIVTGCTPADRSCAHCYAKAIYDRFGRDFGQVTLHPDKLAQWRTAKLPEWSPKRGEGRLPMVFVCDTGDLGHEHVPDGFIWDALTTMEGRHDVTWQILTKRPEHLVGAVDDWLMGAGCDHGLRHRLPPNVWVGVSVCDQATLDERMPILNTIPAWTKFLSVEPMLGPVSIERHAGWTLPNWVICGAESGPQRRPFERAWAQALYDECWWREVPFFGKQDSGLYPGKELRLQPPGAEGPRVVQQWPRL